MNPRELLSRSSTNSTITFVQFVTKAAPLSFGTHNVKFLYSFCVLDPTTPTKKKKRKRKKKKKSYYVDPLFAARASSNTQLS